MTNKILALAVSGIVALAGTSASAATIGQAVLADGTAVESATSNPDAAERQALVDDAAMFGITANTTQVIRYFSNLDASTTPCFFGVDGCGEAADSGTGPLTAGPVSMFIDFTSVEGGNSFLNLFFEDLDLLGASDTEGDSASQTFSESVGVLNGDMDLGTFTSITQPGVGGDANTQRAVSIALGELEAGSTFRVQLDFFSAFTGTATVNNTDEFVLASVDGFAVVPSAVPLPAAGWLLLAGFGGLAAMRKRRKS